MKELILEEPMAMDHKKLQGAFIRSLGLSKDDDVPSLVYGQHALWDSVAHMRLVSEIEAAFDVMLDSEDVIAMSSYNVAVDILQKHGVPLNA
jgi:acyl carrier protein